MVTLLSKWIIEEKGEYELENFAAWIKCILLEASQGNKVRHYPTWILLLFLFLLRTTAKYQFIIILRENQQSTGCNKLNL